MNDRPSRESIHMATALMWAQRSTCSQPDRKIGCVITSEDMRRVLSIGYNGPARSLPDNYCTVWRSLNLEAQTGITIGSRCPCLHAEMNAIAHVDSTIPSKALFVTMQPCEQCAQLILQSNIARVFFWQEYRVTAGVELLRRAGVAVAQLDPFAQTYANQLFHIQKGTSSR